MTFPRKAGFLLLLVALLAAVSHALQIKLPSLSWFFSLGWDTTGAVVCQKGDGLMSLSHFGWRSDVGTLEENQRIFLSPQDLVGYAICTIMAVIGIVLIAGGGGFEWNPVTLRRFARFRSIGRGWLSFKILIVLLALSLLDQAVVGKRALAVKYNGHWSFPAFQEAQIQEQAFGGTESQETDYRALQIRFRQENQGNRVILPPIPWDPVLDSQDVEIRELVKKEDGKLYRPDDHEPYQGQAVQFHKDQQPAVQLRVSTFRKGLQEGNTQIYDAAGEFVGRQIWKEGKLVESPIEGPAANEEGSGWIERVYPPASPTWRPPTAPTWSHPHYFGTDSKGWDVLAILYGGMQVLFQGAVLYVSITYFAGILIGSLMGYVGGWFDLAMQRVMEILWNIPFLLVIMVIVAKIGQDQINLTKMILVYCCFSWLGVAIYLRTATYREKARDYVAAARVQGATTTRLIFRHILPNAISTIVTLLPFSIAGLATSLTALDFLGFGLPDRYPSWGRLLDDGTQNLTTAPWIVISVFAMLLLVLLLITFVGEAIREAFDPKKFTTYR
ncbi:MAG: binding-protein-dependent transport system inner rane component [Akkermansiaceae bacterium]|nr:binding-protein-dependent transport system inner rane component [Akkermansiaceae bacterium]